MDCMKLTYFLALLSAALKKYFRSGLTKNVYIKLFFKELAFGVSLYTQTFLGGTIIFRKLLREKCPYS